MNLLKLFFPKTIILLFIFYSNVGFSSYSYVESTRLSARNPAINNTNYSELSLSIEGSINFLSADKLSGFVFDLTGEMCRKSTAASLKFEMPCNGVMMLTNPLGDEVVNGHFYQGTRVPISNNYCSDFFIEDETNSSIITPSSGLSFGVSLK